MNDGIGALRGLKNRAEVSWRIRLRRRKALKRNEARKQAIAYHSERSCPPVGSEAGRKLLAVSRYVAAVEAVDTRLT
eukprot:1346082-Pleurochrysis_carterae.AAC.1